MYKILTIMCLSYHVGIVLARGHTVQPDSSAFSTVDSVVERVLVECLRIDLI